MKGYKASYNGKCLEQFYEVGNTYKINGDLQICKNGFHFCEKIDDVLDYYDANKDLVLFEVEALGEVITERHKSVTDHIKIVREIPLSEWNELFERYKFDERGNRIYRIDSHGYECHYKYDENNNCIYEKDSKGNELHYKYDENNNLIYKKFPNGPEYHMKYDENNNLINKKFPDGSEYHWKYDERNNCIYKKIPEGNEFHYKYDDNNNIIYKKHSDGDEFHYKYDENNNMII